MTIHCSLKQASFDQKVKKKVHADHFLPFFNMLNTD